MQLISLADLRKQASLIGFICLSVVGLILLTVSASLLRYGTDGDLSAQSVTTAFKLFHDYDVNVTSLEDMAPASVSYSYEMMHLTSEPIPLVEESSTISYTQEKAGNERNELEEKVVSRRLRSAKQLPTFAKWINVSIKGSQKLFNIPAQPEIRVTVPATCPFGYCNRKFLQESCEGELNGMYEGGGDGCATISLIPKTSCGVCHYTRRLASLCVVIDVSTMAPSTTYSSCRYPFGVLDQEYQPNPVRSEFFSIEVVRSDDPLIILQEMTKGTGHFPAQRTSSKGAAGLVCVAMGATLLLVGIVGVVVKIQRTYKLFCSDSTDAEKRPITFESKTMTEAASSEARQQAYRLRMQYYRSQRTVVTIDANGNPPNIPMDQVIFPAVNDSFE